MQASSTARCFGSTSVPAGNPSRRRHPLAPNLIVVNGNPLENLKVLYPSGIGGVEWTIKDGIPYHAPTLMARVKQIVAEARRK
jgi:hypothetical protein